MSATSGCEFWPSNPSAVWSWCWEESLNLSKFVLPVNRYDIPHLIFVTEHAARALSSRLSHRWGKGSPGTWILALQLPVQWRTALLRPLWTWAWTRDFHGTMKWEDKRCVSLSLFSRSNKSQCSIHHVCSPCFCKHGKHRDGILLAWVDGGKARYPMMPVGWVTRTLLL